VRWSVPGSVWDDGTARLPVVGQWAGTQRYAPIQRNDEDALNRAIVTLATKYGRWLGTDHGAIAEHAVAGEQGIGCSASGGAKG
jgi:hypothetical protein